MSDLNDHLDERLDKLVTRKMARTLRTAGVTNPEQFIKIGANALLAVRGAGPATAREYERLIPLVKEMLCPEKRVRRVKRTLKLSMSDVLDMAAQLSGAGHPSDYIEPDARIEMTCSKTGAPRFTITWSGPPHSDDCPW